MMRLLVKQRSFVLAESIDQLFFVRSLQTDAMSQLYAKRVAEDLSLPYVFRRVTEMRSRGWCFLLRADDSVYCLIQQSRLTPSQVQYFQLHAGLGALGASP